MDILLIAGLWLDGSAWDDVAPALEDLGHRPVPLTHPGQGEGSASGTLDDQVAAVLAAVDSASERPMERRFDVPVVLVCPEFTTAQAKEWIDAGDVPELARLLATAAAED